MLFVQGGIPLDMKPPNEEKEGKRMKRKKPMLIAGLLAVALTAGVAGKLYAEAALSSEQCIKCHTDLDRMDEFGAAAAEAGGASIAG
jgi:hypothetical protein